MSNRYIEKHQQIKHTQLSAEMAGVTPLREQIKSNIIRPGPTNILQTGEALGRQPGGVPNGESQVN